MKITAADAPRRGGQGPLQMFFGSTMLSVLTLMIFCPALTMRTFAEERRSRTMETLLTAPVTDEAVVLGKFFGAFDLPASLWVPHALYALVVRRWPCRLARPRGGVRGRAAHRRRLRRPRGLSCRPSPARRSRPS
ncbi:MAG: ABC transporter permease [Polyangiales bacterium]